MTETRRRNPNSPKLSFDLWEALIISALNGWKNGGLASASGLEGYKPQDVANQAFLASCCLVSREWQTIARKRLYSGVRYGALTLEP